MRKAWIFYKVERGSNLKTIIAEREFILPDRSKVWKDLQKTLGSVQSVGYELAESFDPNA